MDPFTTLTAVAAPMPQPNVNTDDIFPGAGASPVAKKMGRAYSDPAQMGLNAFAAWRFDADANPRPDFILNQAPYDAAKILVTGPNFGCGSSREMAVWTLAGIGVRCIVAASFGDIFYNNCFKNGVLPAKLAQADVDALLALIADPSRATLAVDLHAQTITGADGEARRFEVTQYYRDALLNGLDEISATLSRIDRIDAAERAYLAERPWLAARPARSS
jgi:3-isopropylmalate/(R)-2-methylmalate dehydratase small subunit